jgi:hypothetical protein
MKFAEIQTHSTEAIESGNDLQTACVCERCGRQAREAGNEAGAIFFALASLWTVTYAVPVTFPAGEPFDISDLASCEGASLHCPNCSFEMSQPADDEP